VGIEGEKEPLKRKKKVWGKEGTVPSKKEAASPGKECGGAVASVREGDGRERPLEKKRV